MTSESKKMCGAILISMPTIMYGGYFLLTVLSGQQEQLQLTDFQKSMFRAGHAHAGVLVLLALIAQLLADHAALSAKWRWAARILFPVSAIIVSFGFFAAAIGTNVTQPNQWISVLYLGVLLLMAAVLILGIGLIKKEKALIK